MGDIVERIIFDDSKALPSINNITNALKETDKAMESLNEETKRLTNNIGKDVIKTNEEIAKSTKLTADVERKAIKEKIEATEVYGISIGRVKAKLNDYKNDLMNLLKTMTSYIALTKTQEEGVSRLGSVFGGGTKAIRGLAMGFNILKVAIASTGIGALLIALTSLIAFFTRTQKGADFLSRTFAGLKTSVAVLGDVFAKIGEKIFDAFENPKQAVIDLWDVIKENLINRLKAVPLLFSAIGSAISSAFKGNLEGVKNAALDAGQAFIQMGTGLNTDQQNKFADAIKETTNQMKQAAVAAANLEGRKQRLANAQIELTRREAEMRAVIAANKKEADDTNNTYLVRLEAAKKAIGAEQSLLSQRLKLAKENVAIMRAEQNLTENMRGDYQALASAEAEVSNLKAESLQKQIQLNNKLNDLYKEFNNEIKTTKDALFEIAKAYNLITEAEEIEFIKSKQIEELNKMLNLFKQGSELGQDFTKEIEIINKALNELEIEARKVRAIGLLPSADISRSQTTELKKQLQDLIDFSKKTGVDTTQAQQKIQDQLIKIAKNPLKSNTVKIPTIDFTAQVIPNIDKEKFRDAILDFLDDIETFEDLYSKTLNDLFGNELSDKIQGFTSGLGTFVGEWGNILDEATNIQLRNIDKQLKSLSDRRAQLEDDLSKEQELYEKGLANNLSTKKAEVEGILAEEEKLAAERDKLQRQAEKRQLIAETAQQTQALITSSIQIIKGFSNIPIVGLPLGIAAVGALLGFFAKTKADAFKATKLYEGAQRIDDYFGVPNKFGRSDIGNQKGYRLVDEDNGEKTNVIISAREMLLPEKVYQSQRVFFDNLKSGLYNGYDLSSLIANSNVRKGFGVTNINHNHVNIPKDKKIIRQYVPFTGKDGKQRAILQTIKEDMSDGSIIEFNY